MRTLLMAGVVGMLAFWVAAPARAQLAVSADIPIFYEFDEDGFQDASASGIKVGLTLPFLIGIGAESYNVDGKVQSLPAAIPYEYQVTMLDLFLDIPFPAANLVVGGGIGRGEFEAPATGVTFEDAALTQGFFSIGIPFALLFDAHVSYHRIFGEADAPGLTKPLNLDAEMATVGIKIGF